MKATCMYEIEHLAGLDLPDDDVDITCFNPVVWFIAEHQPRFPLATSTWNYWGKPRKIKVTVEAA